MKTKDQIIEKYRELCLLLDEAVDDMSPEVWKRRKDLYDAIAELEAGGKDEQKAISLPDDESLYILFDKYKTGLSAKMPTIPVMSRSAFVSAIKDLFKSQAKTVSLEEELIKFAQQFYADEETCIHNIKEYLKQRK